MGMALGSRFVNRLQIDYHIFLWKIEVNGTTFARSTLTYNLPSINVNPREWIKVNIYRGVNN